MPNGIRVESLVADAPCPYHCPACAEETRERQARRESILLAQDDLFDEPVVPAARLVVRPEPERRAA